ncbi:MAG TPA: tRNA preQ1(34) S-adenosylmethionine ribosyltransferase-isomerase QueA [Dehalococcoidales bacterium]|nr:tRNA preQ1(34) S-adenosylmethionine ribosyltransferase-isomerase QueA [Dehalococcoidales bacterium]
MRTDDFDYNLPPELIAQTPIEPRDTSRLLVLNRQNGEIAHRHFPAILDYLQAGDVMVFNDSRVLPARLNAKKLNTGGNVEILLLKRLEQNLWETLVKPGRRVKDGTKLELTDENRNIIVNAEVIEQGEAGIRTIKFSDESLLSELGQVALPPYIHEPLKNQNRYQTVYADQKGSVAAPTAGLHFTPELLEKIKLQGIKCLFVTLHVGLDTFRPVQENNPEEHTIHKEYGYLSPEVANSINLAKKEGRRVFCVGTTSVRIVETAAQKNTDLIQAFDGWVDLFILPGHKFRVADAMITNFHLPKSTLLMLVSAFAGKELIDKAYKTAITEKYRFYSFGDAMLIL